MDKTPLEIIQKAEKYTKDYVYLTLLIFIGTGIIALLESSWVIATINLIGIIINWMYHKGQQAIQKSITSWQESSSEQSSEQQ